MRLFNHVSFSTPESVELELTLAGIGSRVLALLVDYHIMGLLLLAFWIVWGTFSLGLLSFLSGTNTNYSNAPAWLLAIFVLINFLIFTGYFAFFETVWQGQTPGKRVAKIRVIRDNGRPIRVAQAALRSLLRPIDDLMFIGVFLILFGKWEKRIGDWVAGTIVIREQRPDRRETITVSEEAKQLARQLPQIADLSQLLPDDYAVVRSYLERRSGMEPQARKELGLKLARQLRHLVSLETIPPDTVADHFLEAVYLTYQQQTGERGIID
jgi:uncharacterized RDD family membrane protein YckC